MIDSVEQDVKETQRQGDDVEIVERSVKRVKKRKREELEDVVENKTRGPEGAEALT